MRSALRAAGYVLLPLVALPVLLVAFPLILLHDIGRSMVDGGDGDY